MRLAPVAVLATSGSCGPSNPLCFLCSSVLQRFGPSISRSSDFWGRRRCSGFGVSRSFTPVARYVW